MRRGGLGIIVAAATISAAARATEPPHPAVPEGSLPLFDGAPLTFHAGELDVNAALGVIMLRDDVVVRFGRYRLTSDQLRVGVSRGAALFGGSGRVTLCPCPSPPIALSFTGVKIEAPGDLYVRSPRLELFGVPVFWLPVFWLRSPDQPGILFPTLAIRGVDGVLLGSGVHLPFREDDGASRAFDFTAAAYLKGGFELGARLTTPSSSTRLVADEIRGDRVVVEARGARAAGGVALAWEADALRGARARSGTIDLDAAARPFDHAAVEASIGAGRGAIASLAVGAAVRAARGQGPFAAGPSARASSGGAIGSIGAWSARAGGLVLATGTAGAPLPLADAALAAQIDARPGPFALRLEAGARAEVAADAPSQPSRDAALGARIELGLPVQRAFPGDAGAAPWVHRIEPTIAVAASAAQRRGAFFAPLSVVAPPGLGLAVGGITTSFGRAGGSGLRLEARGGAALGDAGVSALISGRLSVAAPFVMTSVEVAGEPTARARGAALIGRARLGAEDGARLDVGLAGQTGPGAREARALADLRGAVPGGELAYLATSGWTGSAEVVVPWIRVMRTGVRADVDLSAGELLALRAFTGYRHSCGCLALGVSAAHRIGREGVDVIFSIDLVPGR